MLVNNYSDNELSLLYDIIVNDINNIMNINIHGIIKQVKHFFIELSFSLINKFGYNVGS
tara:strand:- start:129 stop:305 length:177 start_codon:yes stop_codon:yes gene_type:complete